MKTKCYNDVGGSAAWKKVLSNGYGDLLGYVSASYPSESSQCCKSLSFVAFPCFSSCQGQVMSTLEDVQKVCNVLRSVMFQFIYWIKGFVTNRRLLLSASGMLTWFRRSCY
jgi:hypothetical protein